MVKFNKYIQEEILKESTNATTKNNLEQLANFGSENENRCRVLGNLV